VAGWFAYWQKWGSLLVERMIDGVEPDSDSFEVISL
jgi:hypothetical protein